MRLAASEKTRAAQSFKTLKKAKKLVDIIDVGIIIEKEVPKARCITKVCSIPAKLNK